jgi:predicted nucleic acid-binding protein
LKVVSNAGPLIALGKLGQLGLLLKLYGKILIPREVYKEVVIHSIRLGAPDAYAVRFLVKQGYIEIKDVSLPQDSPLLALGIDLGEAEVIALAKHKRKQHGCSLITSMHGGLPAMRNYP